MKTTAFQGGRLSLQTPMPRRRAILAVSSFIASAPLLRLLLNGQAASAASRWATGGTAAMKGSYPNPFAAGIGPSCTLYKASTPGPCHAQSIDRQDVSEGHDGLPVRLALLILDHECRPLPGATVEIWHASPDGFYSGSDALAMCTLDQPAAKRARWFRGIQTADEQGHVNFDTCYPGWYSGRAVHIHFTVRAQGQEFLTSQLFFDDALNKEILTTHPVYRSRGNANVSNQQDGVIRQSRLTDYILQTARMDDGALLAWKALVLSA